MDRSFLRPLFFSVLFCWGFLASADPVDQATARAVAARVLAAHQADLQAADLRLVHEAADPEQVLFRVYQVDGRGFVLLTADDRFQPVLGYSTESDFTTTEWPSNLAKWLEGYKQEIRAALLDPALEPRAMQAAWDHWAQVAPGSAQGLRAVPELMQTRWDQRPHVNAQCPGGSVTGCVATAMAQIMKFHNHPAQGAGFHSYNDPNYGTLSANFGATTYNWGAMPNTVSSANSAVATLMYHVGVSVDMQYSPQVSGAWVIQAHSPNTDHNSEYALKTYFGYDASMRGLKRENYSEQQWLNMLRTDLDARRPVLYAGWGSGGGHAFVCDGYDNNGFFHFNWGWGGSFNGYFTVNALSPEGVGTGGGSGGYNSGQQAIFGIKPRTGGGGGGGQTTQPVDLALYAPVNPSALTLAYGQAFSVNTNIVNTGSTNFQGDYCAAVFDAQSNFYGYVQTLSGYNLQAGFFYNNPLVFSSNGLLTMVPGTYYIGIFYRQTGGEWVLAGNGNYQNLRQVQVVNENVIEVVRALQVSPGTSVRQGQPISVNLNIGNDGWNTFIGQYGAGLFTLEGELALELGVLNENNGLPPEYSYMAPYLTFGPVAANVPPGTYLLAVQHRWSNGNWELTGSSYAANPIFVTVTAPELQPDQYEVNNTAATARTMPVNFTGNAAVVRTTGSNLHQPTDQDFYRIQLPAGTNYAVSARVHDSYNSGNGGSYTVDAMFSYSTDGNTWSSVYDDVMPGQVFLSGGGTLLVHVAPYFTGETGSYELELRIERGATVGVDEPEGTSGIRIFPNPANDRLTIDLAALNGQLEAVQLLDLNGRSVSGLELSGTVGQQRNLALGHVAPGAYLLRLVTSVGIRTERVVIAR